MKTKLLTEMEEDIVKKLSNQYLNTINSKSLINENRKFGLEIEFSITDKDGYLKPQTAEYISNKLSKHPIVPELGSYQIELNPESEILKKECFKKYYEITQKHREKLETYTKKQDLKLIPSGLPFNINSIDFHNPIIFTKKSRYQVSAKYFGQENKNGCTLPFKNNEKINLPGNSGLTIINELHIHLQTLNKKEAVDLFNISQMLTAPLISLGANSGIINGKELDNKEQQIKIFEESEGLYDGEKNTPRVGLYPGYLKNIEEYFNKILAFKPLYYPLDNQPSTAFELMIGKYFGWTRLRIGRIPHEHIRIEFRPLSTQPTIIENISIAEFYIKTLLLIFINKKTLLPKKYLHENMNESIKNAMNAELYWDLGQGILKYQVTKILENLISEIKEDEFLIHMKRRIKQKQSPTDKLIKETKKYGFEIATKNYINCFKNEIPYL
jgi:hypothetical protein